MKPNDETNNGSKRNITWLKIPTGTFVNIHLVCLLADELK